MPIFQWHRKYDIPAVSHRGLHKLCYLQIVICWQGLCHDTLLTYLLHLLQESRAAAFFCWPQICCSLHIVSFCFTLININTLLDVLYKHSHFPCGVALLERNKISPQGVYIPHLINSSRPPWSSFPPSCWFLYFDFTMLLPSHLPLRSDLGKWNVVIEEKVQIGSGCKWSLVSGRRFLFRR